MSFLDKFLDAVKVNDDYDDDDAFLDDADDDFEDEKPKKRFFKKLEDDYDDDFDDDLPPVKNTKKEKKEKKTSTAAKTAKQPKSQSASSKVTPMYSVKKKTSGHHRNSCLHHSLSGLRFVSHLVDDLCRRTDKGHITFFTHFYKSAVFREKSKSWMDSLCLCGYCSA